MQGASLNQLVVDVTKAFALRTPENGVVNVIAI